MPLSLKALNGPGRLNKWLGGQGGWSSLSEGESRIRGGWRDKGGGSS